MHNFDSLDNSIIFFILFINSILTIFLIFFSIANSIKIRKLKSKYEKFMRLEKDVDLEKLLESCILKTDEIINKNKEIEAHLNRLDRNVLNCIQKVSISRFNAFDDVGSDLSYSLALLDGNDNGVVITSLYTRDSSTTFGKPIVGGKSKYPLSAEEIKTINDAVRKNRESQYL
ncbi:MAG TPA: DUF4446 family protein [Clostridiaceae bacterium]|nr:DUF4446 family protein [Clostridiaceae bacterium]